MEDFYTWLLAAGVSERTAREYCKRVGYFLSLNLRFADFVRLKKSEVVTNNSINAYIKGLRHYGKYIDNDELRSLKYLPKNTCQVATFTDEEVEIFLEIDDTQPLISLFFSILAYTGMRPIEVNRLEVADFNFADNSLRILSTKTQTYRTIPIPEPIKDAVKDRCNEVDYRLFAEYSPQVLYHHFHKRLKMMGIKRRGLHVYSLRHSYATRMVDADCDPFSVKALLGHSDIHMTERYYHLSAKRLQKVSKRDPLAKAKQCPVERIKTLLNEIQPLLEGFIYDLIQNDDAVILKIKKPLPEAPNRG